MHAIQWTWKWWTKFSYSCHCPTSAWVHSQAESRLHQKAWR
jgi:hypothetical protein